MTHATTSPLHAPVAGDRTADAPGVGAGVCTGDPCITCSDEAVEMRVEGGGGHRMSHGKDLEILPEMPNLSRS